MPWGISTSQKSFHETRFTVTKLVLVSAAAMILCACTAPRHAKLSVDRIVFITIDTLRADHLPSFGYPLETAPFLTSLAQRATSFKKAFAHSATTGPSHASMFTGLYPIQHRVQNNGQKLDSSFVTLAETLTPLGFQTAAFVSGNAHFGSSNIAQGFHTYDQPPDLARKNKGKPRLYRPAKETSEQAIRWLDTVGAADKFLL